MDLFRRNQKLIFWIVTIIIVPSFVLVWGVSGTFGRGDQQAGSSVNVGKVNGHTFTYPEFESFRRRMLAAVGGVPLHVVGAPGQGTPSEDMWKYTFANSILRDAEDAGCHASDLEVGTYLETAHPNTAAAFDPKDPKSLDRAIDRYCQAMQITRAEFLKGVREWRTIANFIGDDARLAAVNDDTVFSHYAADRAECVVKRVRVRPTPAITEQAKKQIMDKPADELTKEVRDHIAARADDRRFRQSPEWRFAYVMIPQAAESHARPATNEEIEAYYNANRTRLYPRLTLDEARDQVKTELTSQELERQTLRNLTIDVDPQLRNHPELDLSELAKLTQLAKYGVKAGDTGSAAVPTAEMAEKLPAGVDPLFTASLTDLDAAPEVERDEIIKEWKEGYNLVMRPIKVENGYLRLRLLDYVPSKPLPIDDADGKVNPQLYELAISDLVEEQADATVRDQAMVTEGKLRELLEARRKGEPAPDAEVATEFDSLPAETLRYRQLIDNNPELAQLVVGDMVGPISYEDPADGAHGQELVIMTDRRVPDRAAFAAEPEAIRNYYRQLARGNYQGSAGFTFTMSGPAAIINPSPAMLGVIAGRFERGELNINRDLLPRQNSEG